MIELLASLAYFVCKNLTHDNCLTLEETIKPYGYRITVALIIAVVAILFYHFKILQLFQNILLFLKKLLRKYKKWYKLIYKFNNYWNNTWALSFSRQFIEWLQKLWDQYNKRIIILDEKYLDNKQIDEKTILFEWCIDEQLNSNDDKVNQWKFSMTYLWWNSDINWLIRERYELQDIQKLHIWLVWFIKNVFIYLMIKNQDYDLSMDIIKTIQSNDIKKVLYYLVYYYQLFDNSIDWNQKLDILNKLIDNGIFRLWDWLDIMASKLFYKTGSLKKSIWIVDIMKWVDSNNPVWYNNRAFLYLAQWNEEKWFDEYEKMRAKFSPDKINNMNMKEIISDIDEERRKKQNTCFDLWIIYLSYCFVPEIFNYTMAKNYLQQVQSKKVKRRLENILYEYENKLLTSL